MVQRFDPVCCIKVLCRVVVGWFLRAFHTISLIQQILSTCLSVHCHDKSVTIACAVAVPWRVLLELDLNVLP
jgi:hypothetical protein